MGVWKDTMCTSDEAALSGDEYFIAASKVSWRGIQRLDHGMCLLVASVFNFLAGGWKKLKAIWKAQFSGAIA
jgi:hypothetical protein